MTDEQERPEEICLHAGASMCGYDGVDDDGDLDDGDLEEWSSWITKAAIVLILAGMAVVFASVLVAS